MLTYALSPKKVQASQLLHEKDHTINNGRFQRISLLVTTSPAFENSHSLATDVAGIERYVCAEAATPGNLQHGRTSRRMAMTSDGLSDFGLPQIALKLVTQRIWIDAPSLAEVSSTWTTMTAAYWLVLKQA